MRFCNAAGALVASRLACADAMPTEPRSTRCSGSVRGAEVAPAPREASGDGFDLLVTPESAGWGFSGLRVLTLGPGERGRSRPATTRSSCCRSRAPCTVDRRRRGVRRSRAATASSPRSRTSSTCRATRRVEIAPRAAGGSRSRAPAPPAASRRATSRPTTIAVELRGAGQASRQVNNFCAPEVVRRRPADRRRGPDAGGNWSSYPPHKHDEASPGGDRARGDLLLRGRARPTGDPGLAYQRVYGSGPGREIDVTAEVRSGDVIIMPTATTARRWPRPATTSTTST